MSEIISSKDIQPVVIQVASAEDAATLEDAELPQAARLKARLPARIRDTARFMVVSPYSLHRSSTVY